MPTVNGVAVRSIRVLSGLPVGRFAAAIDVSPGYLSNIEAGRRTNVSAEIVAKMAAVTGQPKAAFLGVLDAEGLRTAGPDYMLPQTTS
jgi:transcriptional regulator with XRE-family HTH domain